MDVIEVKGINGQVRFDGATVTILRKGFFARTSIGKGEKQIPVAQISAVQFKLAGPFVRGFIQFSFAGGNERRSRFGSQTATAGADENSVLFGYSQRDDFVALRDAVQAAVAAAHSGDRGSATRPTEDIPGQIGALAALHQSGALTDTEFAAKKAELLGRM